MKCWYDFHIHSALSPCGDNDMTPNNIVNMAYIKGLNAIAITDHNCVKNAKAAMEVGEALGITVIPGMEVESSEEIHIVTLFPDLDSALEAEKYVHSHMPKIPNRKDIFGQQLIMDSDDNVTGEFENMLITATDMDIFGVFDMVKQCGGIAYPAHIDRHSYSVISNLGFIPPELDTRTVEISKSVTNLEEFVKNRNVEKYKIIRSSDAHYLENIAEKEENIEVLVNSAKNIIQYFK